MSPEKVAKKGVSVPKYHDSCNNTLSLMSPLAIVLLF